MTTLITTIRQIDGSAREFHAQDAEHARRARELLRQNPALVERLDGVNGVRARIVVIRAKAAR